MKKTKRIALCLMMAVLMFSSFAITAMAANGSGSVVAGNTRYPYNWSISCSSTEGVANISTTDSPAAVKASAFNYLYSEINDAYGYGSTKAVTGYGTVTSKPSTILTINGVNVPLCEVVQTTATFHVAGQFVLTATEAA